MTDRLAAFDSLLFRRIDAGFGEPGVTSWNGQTGDVKGTLANIFAFGAGDDAFNDNNFPMDSGNWRWPGNLSWGAGRWGSASAYFQNRIIDMSRAPAGELKSLAANLSGIGGNGCGAFDELVLNDPLWNGSSFGALFFMAWVAEIVGFSNSILQTSGMPAVEYARRTYFPTGQSPMVPGVGQVGAAMRDSLQLYNDATATVPQVRSVSAYGDEEKLLNAVQNGASAQWVTHWTNNNLTPAAGDGPAWWVDVDSRFGHFRAAAGLQFYQSAADVFLAWGAKLWVTDDAGLLSAGLDVDHTRGLLNGATIATLDPSGQTFQVFETAELNFATTSTGNVLAPAVAGKSFVPLGLSVYRCTAAAGSLTTDVHVSVGSNGGHNNITNNLSLTGTGLFAAGAGSSFTGTNGLFGAGVAMPVNTPVLVDIPTAATGVGLTYKGKVCLLGYYA